MALPSSAMTLLGGARGTPGGADASIDRPREMNRYMGGHRRNNHPFISGYWYILIEPPQRLFIDEGSMVTYSGIKEDGEAGSGYKNGSAAAFETSRWLHSTAESFTPPSRTMTKVDIPALGGVGSSYIAGQQLTRTFSTTFREYQDTPIMNAISRWTSTIDHHYGVSPLKGNEYIPANYKGAAWVFLCKPTVSGIGGASTGPRTAYTPTNEFSIGAKDVEQFFFFEGVFPEGAPYDAFNSDINTNDGIQLNVTWSFDGWPYGREHEYAFRTGLTKLNDIYAFNFEGTHKGHMDELAPPFTQLPEAGYSDGY